MDNPSDDAIALQLAVIEAAKAWRQDGKWDDVPLEEALDALIDFEKRTEES